MMGLDIMYTIKEAHEKLNCNRQTVNNWIKRLDIEVATIDGMYRLTEEQYNMIADKVNANRTNQYTNEHTNRANVDNDGANNTNQDTNNNTESNNVVEILQSHIDEQRNTIRDLSRMLDQQQQLTQSSNKKVSKLENKLEEYKYKLEDSNSVAVSTDTKRVLKVKNRKKVNSNNVDDTYTYEDAHTRPTDESDTNEDVEDTNESTNEPIDVSDQTTESSNTNVSKPNKRKGFFARLFNL